MKFSEAVARVEELEKQLEETKLALQIESEEKGKLSFRVYELEGMLRECERTFMDLGRPEEITIKNPHHEDFLKSAQTLRNLLNK